MRSRGSVVEEATSIVMDGLVEVLKERGVQCCSVVLPGSASIKRGKEFAQLTNTVSGVAVVLRVSLLVWLHGGDEEDLVEEGAGGGRRSTTLSSLMDELSVEGESLYVPS